jgi:hypothetical protein
MMPEHFRWVDSSDEPGVAYKWLASFTERQMRVGFIRLQPGAAWTVLPNFDPHILFITAGRLKLAGRSYPLHTAFAFRPEDGPVSLQAEEETEMLCIQFPKQAMAALEQVSGARSAPSEAAPSRTASAG